MDSLRPQQPAYGLRQAQGDHGVDLEALRAKLEKMHGIPQLRAGVSGKLEQVKPEPQALTEEEAAAERVKALAKCVAQAEGEWIDKSIRRIMRDDYIGMSYTRRYRKMMAGDVKPMADMLNELEIKIDHLPPPEDHVLAEDCLLYRRLCITKAGVVRAEEVWEWSPG